MACTADRTKRLFPICLIAYRIPDPLLAGAVSPSFALAALVSAHGQLYRSVEPDLQDWLSGSDGNARIRDVLSECQSSVPNVHPSLAGCVVGSFVGPWAINADMKAACGND